MRTLRQRIEDENGEDGWMVCSVLAGTGGEISGAGGDEVNDAAAHRAEPREMLSFGEALNRPR